MKLALHATMKVLELEIFVERDGSYQKSPDAKRKWEGNAVVHVGSQGGHLNFLELEKRLILFCSPLRTIRHRMYIPSDSSIENQIEVISHMSLITDSGEAIKEPNLMEACLKQIEMDKSLYTEINVK